MPHIVIRVNNYEPKLKHYEGMHPRMEDEDCTTVFECMEADAKALEDGMFGMDEFLDGKDYTVEVIDD
jgi:hypothetical protein